MLDQEYKFYSKNKASLIRKHKGKFVVIKGKKIIGAYPSEREAYSNTIDKHKLGTFLIQQCLPDNKKVIQAFHSRVIF